MRRTYQVNEQCDIEVLVTDITENEKVTLNSLIDGFRRSHAKAQTMAEEISEGIAANRITSSMIERLSKWCNTGEQFSNGQDSARRLAQYLLRVELPRLVDQNNHREPDYREQIILILQQYIGQL